MEPPDGRAICSERSELQIAIMSRAKRGLPSRLPSRFHADFSGCIAFLSDSCPPGLPSCFPPVFRAIRPSCPVFARHFGEFDLPLMPGAPFPSAWRAIRPFSPSASGRRSCRGGGPQQTPKMAPGTFKKKRRKSEYRPTFRAGRNSFPCSCTRFRYPAARLTPLHRVLPRWTGERGVPRRGTPGLPERRFGGGGRKREGIFSFEGSAPAKPRTDGSSAEKKRKAPVPGRPSLVARRSARR